MLANVWSLLLQWQQTLNSQFSTIFRQLDEGGISTAAMLVLVAFAYGVIHAAGPGHGKAIIGSYFLARGGRIAQVAKISYLVAIVHACSALLVTLVIYFFLDGIFRQLFGQTEQMLFLLSGVMIILIGSYLLWRFVRNPATCCGHHHDAPALQDKSPYALALSIGIVPCPGVMTVLLFSLALGHLAMGVLAAIVMSVGMGITIFAAGLLSIGAHKGTRSIHPRLVYLLGFGGPVLIITLGVLLVALHYGRSAGSPL
ncbi:nickel/cobalt transporter [Desulfurispira natronophila]|uniref:Nickel/cobalt efflux system n=1 Tax=Desulfurispira natronophila TaxID=682562 RepID=A0A7W7Y4K1_9BACT|nr:high frequency lysogenization protein HflD [Desulfurispira natronophila]MBB5021804.1 ABC-type nickel/cobalt efflux system permease component RcnA [Desulfurispira natronophila]